jgi:hypothetical protein
MGALPRVGERGGKETLFHGVNRGAAVRVRVELHGVPPKRKLGGSEVEADLLTAILGAVGGQVDGTAHRVEIIVARSRRDRGKLSV